MLCCSIFQNSKKIYKNIKYIHRPRIFAAELVKNRHNHFDILPALSLTAAAIESRKGEDSFYAAFKNWVKLVLAADILWCSLDKLTPWVPRFWSMAGVDTRYSNPRLRILIAAFTSALFSWPQATQWNLSCVVRFSFATWPHSAQVWLVWWAGTASNQPPNQACLYSSCRLNSPHPWSRIERLSPDFWEYKNKQQYLFVNQI